MKMFYIWITMRCYYAFLSIDVSVFFHSIFFETFASEIVHFISSIKLLLLYKVYGIRFRSEIICSS